MSDNQNLICVPSDLFVDLVEIACEHESDKRWMKRSSSERMRREWKHVHDAMQRAVAIRKGMEIQGSNEVLKEDKEWKP